jgi:hypothetical protein
MFFPLCGHAKKVMARLLDGTSAGLGGCPEYWERSELIFTPLNQQVLRGTGQESNPFKFDLQRSRIPE